VLAEIEYQEAVDMGNVTPLAVIMMPCVEGPDVTRDMKSRRAQSLRRAIWRNEVRNRTLIEGMHQAKILLEEDDPQTLFMVESTEHAFLLGQLLPDYAIVHGPIDASTLAKFRRSGVVKPDQVVCTVKDRTRHKMAFESGELRKAISTKVWKQGVDFKDLQILVRCDGAASAIDANQISGRLSRITQRIDKPLGVVVDSYDQFSKILKGFSEFRIKSYTRNGWAVDRRALH
jgi:hypothetical protein